MAATQFRTRTAPNPPPPPEEIEGEEAQKPIPTGKTGKPGKADDSPVFWELITGLTEDEWTNHICYWYRLGPKIDRSTSGRGLNIKSTAHAFTLDTVMKEEGSGVYRFDLLRRDPKTGKSALVQRHYDQILNMSYPPRVPYGPWINESENALWKWAEEPLRIKEAQSQARIDVIENGGPATAADPSQIFTTILEGVKTLRPDGGDNNTGLAGQLLTIVLKNQESMQALNDPAKQLATLKSLLDSLRPPTQGNDASTMMLEFMREQTAALREEIKEMRQAANTPRKSVVEELRELSGVFTEIAPALGFRKSGAGGTPNPPVGTDWGNVLERVTEKAAPYIFPLIQNLLTRAPNGTPAPPPGWQPTQTPQITAAQQQPNPQPQQQPGETQPDMPQLTPEEQQQQQQFQAKMQAYWTKHQQIITQCIPFVLDKFKTENGYELRDWFIDRNGRFLWVGMKDDGGAEILTALACNHPHLRLIMQPPDKVAEFFSEFFTDEGQEAAWWREELGIEHEAGEPDNAA